jgi:hypothetical protein
MSLGSRGTQGTSKGQHQLRRSSDGNAGCGIPCGYLSPELCKCSICFLKHLFTWVASLCPS